MEYFRQRRRKEVTENLSENEDDRIQKTWTRLLLERRKTWSSWDLDSSSSSYLINNPDPLASKITSSNVFLETNLCPHYIKIESRNCCNAFFTLIFSLFFFSVYGVPLSLSYLVFFVTSLLKLDFGILFTFHFFQFISSKWVFSWKF